MGSRAPELNERDSPIDAEADGAAALPLRAAPRANPWQRFLRRQVHARLAALEQGRLVVRDPLGAAAFGPADAEEIRVRIRDASAWADMATGGTIGAAEAYMAGKWAASDLTRLVRLFVANRAMMQGFERGLASLAAPLLALSHRLRRNTRTQARRNIGAHYDLGNEFYRLFLDRTMSYSAAIYPRPESTLDEAAVHKLDAVCRKLALAPDDHLLEIGTGWGGLALHAARHYGCRVTTTTISARQREYALEQVRAAGLSSRVTVLDQDYRDLEGHYDKLVSIEMIEAVGLDFLPGYFRVCADRLKPGGRMLLQSIVIADHLYEEARRSVDFIQKYIFPGGALPSVAVIDAMARLTGLERSGLEDIGPHYARTLRDWRERFLARLPEVRRLGFSDEFIRLWEFYFAYCEGGFLERAIGNVQVVFDKPR